MNGDYEAFLLRLQRSETAAHWRATLENAHTGEVLRFPTEQQFMSFLWQMIGNGRLQLETPPLASSHNTSAKTGESL